MGSNLPWELKEIYFCDIDTTSVERAIFDTYEQTTGRKLYPGNPERLFLEAVAYVIAQQRFLIDYAAKMNLLSYAQGEYLDHIGAMLATFRLQPNAARTVLRFSLDAPLSFDVIIPEGTRATPDSEVVFRTTQEAKIASGETYVDVDAVCEQEGTVGNGFVPGQINELMDPVAYVSKVENITVSLGGTDTEDDERFRERIRLAPERFSTCGPKDAYRWWAMSVSQEIIDVAVWSPEPGKVHVAPLLVDCRDPDDELIRQIGTALLDEKVRPLTDVVVVQKPEKVQFNISGTYYILSSYSARVVDIQSKVQSAVNEYVAWQASKLGRAIRPTELIARVQGIDGIQRINLTEPEYKALEPWQVGVAESVNLQYGGLSSE